MKEIIFTTNHEPVLSFADKDFKTKYEERVGNNPDYIQVVNGETKHLALCPLCNNPVAILGIPMQDMLKELIFLTQFSIMNTSFRIALITKKELII